MANALIYSLSSKISYIISFLTQKSFSFSLSSPLLLEIHSLWFYWQCKVVILNYVLLVLFYGKKCCNCINLFLWILWDLIVMDLILNWWRTEQLATSSQVNNSQKIMWEAHAGSWRVKCQKGSCDSFRDLANLRDTLPAC